MSVPLNPRHPERICWGCDKYCPAAELACGNGTPPPRAGNARALRRDLAVAFAKADIRTPHPNELFGDDWLEWSDRTSSGKHIDRQEG